MIAGDLNADPSRGLRPLGNGVFWPTSDDPLYRLVWQDVRVV